jgi:hypothetical protein
VSVRERQEVQEVLSEELSRDHDDLSDAWIAWAKLQPIKATQ